MTLRTRLLFLFLAVKAAQSLSSTVLSNKKVCIAGAGPCGLYIASLILQKDPTVKISILEKSPRSGGDLNAFGIGLGTRLLNSLDEVPGLRERVESVGAKMKSINGLSIASRADIVSQMAGHLEDTHSKGNKGDNDRCRILFDEGYQSLDFENRKVTTTKGNTIEYDLLIAADGVNSRIRQRLVKERGLQESHYLAPNDWKALKMPPQPEIEATSFMPLVHPFLAGGRVLPRHPEGHILLMFWVGQEGMKNPGHISSVEEAKEMITEALRSKRKTNIFRRLLGMEGDEEKKDKRKVVFDEAALEQFVSQRSGKSHYMKVDRFHDGDSVVLLGDAAHGMYSLLGQGCACGLKSAQTLADCLFQKENADGSTHDLGAALNLYSKRAKPEADAITDLNLISHVLTAGPVLKAVTFPIIFMQSLRGKVLFKRLGNVKLTFQELLKENRLLISLARRQWKKERIPFGRPGEKAVM